jgi:hypothetical protein
MHQVGFITCIYRDAWSTKHKKKKNTSLVAKTAIIFPALQFPTDINTTYSSYLTEVAVHTNYVTSKWFNNNRKSD